MSFCAASGWSVERSDHNRRALWLKTASSRRSAVLPDTYVRSAGTIWARAACQPGAIPARTPTIAEITRLMTATGIEGRKAIVTASAPTDRWLNCSTSIAAPTPKIPPATLKQRAFAENELKHARPGEPERLQNRVFPDAILDRHERGRGHEREHQSDAGVRQVAREADELRQVAEAFGLKDAFGPRVGRDGAAAEHGVDLLRLRGWIDAGREQHLVLRDGADQVFFVAALEKIEVRVDVVLLGLDRAT